MFPSSSSSNSKSDNNVTSSSSSSYPTGPLSPNSAEFMALLEKQFRSPATSGGNEGMGGMGGLDELSAMTGVSLFGGMRTMGMHMTPPIDSDGFALGSGAGGAAGVKVEGKGTGNLGAFGNLDSFLPYTNGTANLSSTGTGSRNPGGSGSGMFQPSMNTLGGGNSYGIQTPEGSSGSRRVISGSGGPESGGSTGGSPDDEVSPKMWSSSGAGGSGSGPTKRNTGRGTIKRDGSGDATSGGIAHSKRKAEGDGIRMREEEDESGSSDDDEIPATSRRTTKTTTATSASRRKSAMNTGTPTSGGGGENKAMKRKEQNRAAQKAFRERREQRVKDLEDKVRDLEEQSMGQSIENENLRQLLSKLQQENKTLVQTSFSFKGPMPTMNDLSAGNLQVLQSARGGLAREPAAQTIKPPSPPISIQDSRKDSQTSQDRPSPQGGRGSTDMTEMTPASTVSKGSSSSSPPGVSSSGTASGFFTAEPYNAFATGAAFGSMDGGLPPAYGVAPSQIQSQNTQTFPSSTTTNRMAPPPPPVQQQSSSLSDWMIIASSSSSDPSDNVGVNATTPFTILSQNPAFTSFRDDTPFGNIGNLGFGTFDYRDTGRLDASANDLDDPFAGLDGMGDAAMEDFLKSLADGAGGSMDNAVGIPGDNAFSVTADGMQVMNPDHSKYYIQPGSDAMDTGADLLDAYLRDSFPTDVTQRWAENAARTQSGSSAGGNNANNTFLSPLSASSNSAFSPSNYFTLSPEPQPSTGSSSVSRHDSTSSGSPMHGQTSVILPKGNPLAVGTLGPVTGEMCEGGSVVSKEGKLLSPEEMWTKVTDRLDLSEGLDMDDLCSQLKAKAVCGGIGPVVPEATLDRALDEYAAHKRATAAQMQSMTK